MIADELAKYAYNLKYSDLGKQTIHNVKRHFLDALGCAIAARNAPPVKIIKRIKENTLPIKGFLYGTAIRYLDYDDWYAGKAKEPAHPNDNFGITLSVAEAVKGSGKDFILASALGYEIQCRLCDSANLRKKGWDHVIYGAVSAPLAAGKLMGLHKEQLTQAINITLHTNISSRQVREAAELSMWKACAFSNVVRNALFSVQLAKQGMQGPNEIFEGKWGIIHQLTSGFKLNMKAFGKQKKSFAIDRCWMKKWPAEIHSQSAIQAALELRREVHVKDIQKIEIESHEAGYTIIGKGKEKWKPSTRETADHSLPYIVTAALIDGKIDEQTFAPKKFRNKKYLSLLQKVSVKENKGLTKYYPWAAANLVRVRLKTGKVLEKKVLHHRGHEKNKMTDVEVEEKFRQLTTKYLSKAQQNKIIKAIWNLDKGKVNWKLFTSSIV